MRAVRKEMQSVLWLMTAHTRATPTEFLLVKIGLPRMARSTTVSDVLAVGFGCSHAVSRVTAVRRSKR